MEERKSDFLPLPNIPENILSRSFTLQPNSNVTITSLDITSHGCFVLAGCSNGMVLLFDLTSQEK
jgi:hypothetical protein